MADVNKVLLSGKIAGEVYHKVVGQGSSVANFTVLTTKTVNGKTFSQYNRCVAWRNLADQVMDAAENSPIDVVGELKHSSYEDKDGKKVYKTEVEATEITLGEYDPFADIA